MMSVIQFPTPTRETASFSIEIQTTILEDDSIWYRLTDIKTGGWGEWIKLEGE